MTNPKHRRYVLLFSVVVLVASYFSLGELSTAHAQEISNAADMSIYYIGRNTRKLFGLILIALAIFGGIKGWRRAVVLGCFLTFLGLASIGLFVYGKLIAAWLTSADSKLIPTLVFFAGGMLYISILHKLYGIMNAFLKKHL